MRAIRLCTPSHCCNLFLMALAIICCLMPGEAVSQEQKKDRPKDFPPAATKEMQVIPAKFVKARELGPVIQQVLFGHPVRVSFDERSNSLIVMANAEDMALVKELIKQIDVSNVSSEPRVRFLSLKNAKVDAGLQQMLGRLLPR